MRNDPLPRLDENPELVESLLPECRLRPGEIWEDPEGRHRVGCLDASSSLQMRELAHSGSVQLAVQDPPYNLIAFEARAIAEYIEWSRRWLKAAGEVLAGDASLYVWLGADQNEGFQPLADFMILMREIPSWRSRSFITMRNQRGYGTQHNWMAVRQELICYTRGKPPFEVQYTGIPKVLRGYYKDVGGRSTENMERSRSDCIRASNVWVDVQQVFYRMEENVSGCYAQKPLAAIERIIQASSDPGSLILDGFAHSGTTLLACERLGRRCVTSDVDPLYCEITIRRLEQYRENGRTGWQNGNAFQNRASAADAPADATRQPTLF